MAGFGSISGGARKLTEACSKAVACPASSSRSTAAADAAEDYLIDYLPADARSAAWELALDAWMDLKAQGYVIQEARIRELLPKIAARVPRAEPGESGAAAVSGQAQRDFAELFESSANGADPPVFLTLLRAQGGQVHFLYFWKAFGEAANLVGFNLNEDLIDEIEILRDRLLRHFEEKACVRPSAESSGRSSSSSSSSKSPPLQRQCWGHDKRVLPIWALVEEVHYAASMSQNPRFWQRISETLSGQLELEELSLEEITGVLLAWLYEMKLWGRCSKSRDAQQSQRQFQQADSARGGETHNGLVANGREIISQSSSSLPVKLHIYDVSQEAGIQKLNRILAHKHSPLKLGGVFHAGVEVNGLEWSYGYSPSATRPGIACMLPRTHPQHHYRQTVTLRDAGVSAEDIGDIISQLLEEYPGDDYHLLKRNCCHFADEFGRRLGAGSIPGWVHRLARLGAGIETLVLGLQRQSK